MQNLLLAASRADIFAIHHVKMSAVLPEDPLVARSVRARGVRTRLGGTPTMAEVSGTLVQCYYNECGMQYERIRVSGDGYRFFSFAIKGCICVCR